MVMHAVALALGLALGLALALGLGLGVAEIRATVGATDVVRVGEPVGEDEAGADGEVLTLVVGEGGAGGAGAGSGAPKV